MSRVVAAASFVAVLGLTAACGGGADGKGADKPAADSGSSASGEGKGRGEGGAEGAQDKGAPALTAAQLEKALLSGDDVKGLMFEKIPEKDYPKPEEIPDAGPCDPLVRMVTFSTEPEAEARVAAGGMDAKFTALSSVALFAHEQSDAEKILGDVREALDDCEKFEAADTGYSGIEAKPAPKAGDESVAYALTGESDGESGAIAFTVVRSGSTVLTFYTANMQGDDATEVPKAVVDAQLAKLEKTAG
ncbi:hypothetical protein [Streptomyces sp. Da 82-17]|uniref:hypothetical protein n=1 Tax=Streptomyces sp. Da 82-17 TaxID=3377116 RepID=UPI0038D3A3DB